MERLGPLSNCSWEQSDIINYEGFEQLILREQVADSSSLKAEAKAASNQGCKLCKAMHSKIYTRDGNVKTSWRLIRQNQGKICELIFISRLEPSARLLLTDASFDIRLATGRILIDNKIT